MLENDLISRAVAPLRKHVKAIAIFSMFMNLLMLTGPLYMLQIYDRVLPSGSHETLLALTLIAVILYGASGCLDYARSVVLRHVAHRFELDLAPTVLANMLTGAVNARGRANDQPIRDLKLLRGFVASPAPYAVFDLPWAPFYLVVIFLLHWLLGLVALFSMGVLIVLAWRNRAASEGAIIAGNALSLQSSALSTAMLRNAEAIVGMGMGKTLGERWQALERKAFGALASGGKNASAYAAATRAFRLLAQSLILGAGALLAVDHAVTAGVMIAASILLGRALAPIDQTVGYWSMFTSAFEALKRLKAFLAQAPVPTGHIELPPPNGKLAVEALFGGPVTASKPLLQNISFGLEPGEALGIIGPSGSGKSTLVRHLVGLNPPRDGCIRLDGADLRHWDRDNLGRFVGYLPQDVEILSGTIAENISRFQENASSEGIIEAARLARAHEMILRLPEGYASQVGEWGLQLSAGQRQRLALARAVYGNPALIVLDEPTSNLDAEGEAALNDCVADLKARGRTVILVGHRPSAVAEVDHLLVLDEGRMRAFGPRREIFARFASPALRNVSAMRIANDGSH